MNLRLTIKLWKKYLKEHTKRVGEKEAEGVLNYESSDDEKDIVKATPSPRKSTKNVNPLISVAQVAPSEWLTQRQSKAPGPTRRESALKAI